MPTILDMGERGRETTSIEAPTPSTLTAKDGIEIFEPIFKSWPTEPMDVETSDRTKETIHLHELLLSNPDIFSLLIAMAPYEPSVYARKGQERAVEGILTLNHNDPSVLYVLPLIEPYPLTKKGNELLPAAETTTMLAGSAQAERPGILSHEKPPTQDYEDTLTIIGAVSLEKNTILDENGNHTHFAVRQKTTLANGLTDGSAGNVFKADGAHTAGFRGYGMPISFRFGSTEPTDAIYIPKEFLPKEQAYGVYYKEAADVALGAALQIMYQRIGRQRFSDQLRRIASAA